MMNDLLMLPTGEKKVAAKVMYRLGWGARKIEEILDVSDTSVLRYANEATPEELEQFESDFSRAITDMKKEGLALAQQRLLQLLPKEKRIDQVVKAAEYLEGKHQPQQLTQVNIGAGMGLEFSQDVEDKIT